MQRLSSLLLLAAAAAAQDTVADRFLSQEREAFGHFERKDHAKAVEAFEAQIAIFKDNPRPYYNIACCYALQGEADRAATWLRLAIDHGWRDAEWLANDSDFDGIRETDAYRACWRELADARRADPPAMPRRLPLGSVPSADSVREAIGTSFLEERILRDAKEELLAEHQLRKEFFRLYDERVARLGRYIAENGDARDSDRAGHERVRTAMLYLSHAGEDDDRLRRVAAGYVVRMADEFLRGWPSSPLLPDVLYWRAYAKGVLDEDREETLDTLRHLPRDFPDFRFADHARAELCVQLLKLGRRDELKRALARVEARAEKDPALRARLMEARLVAKGLPKANEFDPRGFTARHLKDWDGYVLLACVATGDTRCERLLKTVRDFASGRKGLKTFVFVLDPPEMTPDDALHAWIREHAAGVTEVIPRARQALDLLWLDDVPTLILARNGAVLAVDPTDAELAKALGGSS